MLDELQSRSLNSNELSFKVSRNGALPDLPLVQFDDRRSLSFFGKDRGCNALQDSFQSFGSERFNQMCLKAGAFAFG